jgi:hypothetical protein
VVYNFVDLGLLIREFRCLHGNRTCSRKLTKAEAEKILSLISLTESAIY